MIDELARHLHVHRSIAYRIVRTLEDHSFVRRDTDGRCLPGERLAALGRNVRMPLQAAALPELTAMAEDLGMTAFLVIRVDDDAVTIESIEPRTTSTHVAYRPGSRHAIDRGAPGLALLAGDAPVPGERPEVTTTRQRGWATTAGEVTPGLASVASWIVGPDERVAAAVACVFLAGIGVDLDAVSVRVQEGANAITHTIGGHVGARQ
jgi:DNA-binding IclR family transcriptional regulator